MKIKKLSTLKELKDGYEIFRHCMYQPTEEKYRKKMTEWMEEKTSSFMPLWKKTG